ncbi:fido domain-containing protein [Elsinoe ampelina]|uniref:Fido domain-containing protein n=1 Tax=Elsinoe ampelina TaxID=302913 RepID=A0A6A6G3R7_9PEZI|nr:fido domain-containing protein [Elsinoe ampelina]
MSEFHFNLVDALVQHLSKSTSVKTLDGYDSDTDNEDAGSHRDVHDEDDDYIETGTLSPPTKPCSGSPEEHSDLRTYITKHLIALLHGSNHIERAGSSLALTAQIAGPIFQGKSPPSYPALQHDLTTAFLSSPAQLSTYNIPLDAPIPSKLPLQTYHEITSHALALVYFIHTFSISRAPLTESLILATHRILTDHVPASDGIPSTSYGGTYRTCRIFAGFTEFPAPEQVPRRMSSLVRSINALLPTSEPASGSGFNPNEDDEVDPLDLAARLSHSFVNIHPFLDGNGRMTRILLNGVLMRYGLLGAVLGGTEEERERYLAVAVRGSEKEEAWEGMDEEERRFSEEPWGELGELVGRSVKTTMKEWRLASGGR